MRRKMCIYKCMLNVYKNQQNRQTGSRNLMGPKTLPTIWGTYMKLVTKYQISAINRCWEKCDEKCAYMFNVYKNQRNWQTGSKNATHNMVYLYDSCDQISDFFHQQLLGKMRRKYLGRTDRGKTVYPPPPSGSGGIKIDNWRSINIKHYIRHKTPTTVYQ